jgi:hypothetical protein
MSFPRFGKLLTIFFLNGFFMPFFFFF